MSRSKYRRDEILIRSNCYIILFFCFLDDLFRLNLGLFFTNSVCKEYFSGLESAILLCFCHCSFFIYFQLASSCILRCFTYFDKPFPLDVESAFDYVTKNKMYVHFVVK